MIHAKAISLRITVREKSPLKHFIGREAYTVNNIGRIKRRLLNLGKEIVRITIKFKYTHIT